MFRFYFDLHENNRCFPDPEGDFHPSRDSACKAAEKVLRDLVSHSAHANAALTVRDEAKHAVAHLEAVVTVRYF